MIYPLSGPDYVLQSIASRLFVCPAAAKATRMLLLSYNTHLGDACDCLSRWKTCFLVLARCCATERPAEHFELVLSLPCIASGHRYTTKSAGPGRKWLIASELITLVG